MTGSNSASAIELPDRSTKQTSSIAHQNINEQQQNPISSTSTDHANHVDAKLPREDLMRLIAAGFAFFCSGINDGSLGPLIPYLLEDYQIGTNFVSIVYGVTFFGWFSAAATNSHLTQLFDLGAVLTIGAIFQLIAHCLRAWRAPFGLFAASFWFAHIGQGYQDMHANSWVATVKAAHRWLGFIHAMYMLGCLVGM
jgi:fucose permease